MRRPILLCGVVLAICGCGTFLTEPPRRCYWTTTATRWQADTIRNELPDDGTPGWVPFVVVLHEVRTDSARVCP